MNFNYRFKKNKKTKRVKYLFINIFLGCIRMQIQTILILAFLFLNEKITIFCSAEISFYYIILIFKFFQC